MYRKLAFQPGQQPEVTAYRAAEQRCTNPKDPSYWAFGGKGIEFRFKSFREFWESVGPRPEGVRGKRSAYALRLIDDAGHYEPGNVIWRDRSEPFRRRNSNRNSLNEWHRTNTPAEARVTRLSLQEKIIAYITAHPELTYEQISRKTKCTVSDICKVVSETGMRRQRGKRAEKPEPGTRFGKWTVVSTERMPGTENSEGGKWLCKCDCGTERWVRSNNLKMGGSTNCGCVPGVHSWTPEMRAAMSERVKQIHVEHPDRNRKIRKLTDSQCRAIRKWHRRGLGYYPIGKHYGVSASTIENIIKGRTYKDV